MAIVHKKMLFLYKSYDKIKNRLNLMDKSKEEIKAIKLNRVKRVIAIDLSVTIFVVFIITSILLIRQIGNNSDIFIINILIGITIFLLYPISIIIGIFLSYNVYKLFRVQDEITAHSRQSLNLVRKEFCEKHRTYYGLNKPYIITKCYSCFNQSFNNKDICMFRKKDKLCFTIDIVNGFINADCDLGIYEIDNDSIKEVIKISYLNSFAYKIIIDDKEMIVGKKAKFILVDLNNAVMDNGSMYKHITNNKNEIANSKKCGCFYCKRIFDAKLVDNFLVKEGTALCPFCMVDMVIGDASGYNITKKLLIKNDKRTLVI